MRHVLDVEEPTRTRDAVNALVTAWAPADGGGEGVRAHVRPASTFERQAYAHEVGGVSHVVTIRHPGFTIDKRHRLKWGDRILEVRGVMQPDEQGRFVVIRCDETLTGGGGDDGA